MLHHRANEGNLETEISQHGVEWAVMTAKMNSLRRKFDETQARLRLLEARVQDALALRAEPSISALDEIGSQPTNFPVDWLSAAAERNNPVCRVRTMRVFRIKKRKVKVLILNPGCTRAK